MFIPSKHLSPVTGLVLLAALPATAVHGQDNPVNRQVGSLTCSYDESREASDERSSPVICDYRPVSGPTARYEGFVSSQAGEAATDLQNALLWTVFASDGEVDIGDLSGRYTGVIDSQAQGENDVPVSLTGGNEIELKPMSEDAHEGSGPAILELEIYIKAVKA
ncbi:DUF992 domain-containing protein [Hoeflea sp. WL0058]|uniref:DUF992 domain-containing protein n=1 Tax=Flavimaribacter sediminis TaxID=2865987 RepID=A0AAE2ZKL2_9HYPH|nr:DUF992 domain-containing protein [Flavimaribacter sediminis]MBW8636372.1 DUF992 domain-containing protein [Flavimaribacter sediminis]